MPCKQLVYKAIPLVSADRTGNSAPKASVLSFI